MANNSIEWGDIALHTVPAFLWAIMAGGMATAGWVQGGVPGALFIAATLIALAGGIYYWGVREWLQHKRAFGGRQSHLEWVIPAGASIVAYPIGFGLGFLLV